MGALRIWDWFSLAFLIFWDILNDIWWFVDLLWLILCSYMCGDSIPVECWNGIEMGLHHIQQISGCIRQVSRRIQQVSLIESSNQINMLGYASWSIRCKLHAYPYRIHIRYGIQLDFGESVQHRWEVVGSRN
jgi:hypothetical protein